MKKLFIYILLLTNILSYSQKDSLEINIDALNIEEAIFQIENQTNYKFFYKKEWLEKYSIVQKIRFEKKTIEDILNFILKDTKLNYHINDYMIILTENRFIYGKVNSNFIKEKDSVLIETKPIFIKQEKISENGISQIIIGKETITKKGTYHEITGYVFNKKTKSPVQDVNFKIQNKTITTSDENGFYKLKLPYGKHILELDVYGFKKTNISLIVYNSGTTDFNLDESITELNEVIIEGISDKNIKSITSGVTSINMEDVKNVPMVLGERDILKIATTIPGIKNTGEGAAGINVRGGKEDQNLFLLDNATIYNPSHFFGFFSSINPYIIKSADIYKGSIPAEFGGRLSSVFDIKSKSGNKNKISGEGGIGPVTSNITISTPVIKDKSSLLFGGRATYSDWILKEIDNPEIKNSKASFYDIFLKYSHKLNQKTEIESTIYYSSDLFNLTSDSTYNYSNRVIALNAKHSFNEKHNTNFGITNSEYKFGINFDKNNQKSFDFGFKVNETKMFYEGNYSYNEKNKFKYGLNSTLYNINPGTLKPTDENSLLEYQSIQKEKGLENALFLSNNLTITKRLTLNSGLRFSNFLSLGPSKQRKYQPNAPLNENNVSEEIDFKKNEIIKSYPNGKLKINYQIVDRRPGDVEAVYADTSLAEQKLNWKA